jgi:hypothetical protein
MNKQEAMKKLADTERELAELRAIIEAPESNRWTPREGEGFSIIKGSGNVGRVMKVESSDDIQRMVANGNCFKTDEEAMESLKYVILNSKYDYWIPGVSKCKPDFEPKGLEHLFNNAWGPAGGKVEDWHSLPYRWKRSKQ